MKKISVDMFSLGAIKFVELIKDTKTQLFKQYRIFFPSHIIIHTIWLEAIPYSTNMCVLGGWSTSHHLPASRKGKRTKQLPGSH